VTARRGVETALRAALARRADSGRPLSPNAVGKTFTVLVRRFVRSAVGVEVSRMLGHTSEVFSQTRYGHLTDDAGDSLLPLYGMSA
jgi:hypothetical protein